MVKSPTVVILAGGENSRFFPLNVTTHKGALSLQGKSLIVRTLENLEENGFLHVVIVVSQKDFGGKGLSGLPLSNFSKLKIEFILQKEPLGMGNAVLTAKEKIKDSFAVVFPYQIDAGKEIRTLIEQAGAGGALAVAYTKTPWLYGIVTLTGKRIQGIEEKPVQGTEKSNLKDRGLHYLSHEFIAFLEQTPLAEYSYEDALNKYAQVFEVNAVEQINPLPSLKYPWHLFDFQSALFNQMPQYVSPYAQVAKTVEMDASAGPIYIENGAKIGHSVKLVGPVYIGKNVFIGDFSLIRSSSFEEGASVGVHSDVTRSIIMEHTSMHNGFLGDSILGRNVQIGAGFISSNKRMDRKLIDVIVKNQKISTGRKGIGTVIGDDAKIGIRVNTMPGKFIGCRSIVYPGITVWEHISHDCVVKQRHNITVETKI